MLEPEPAPKPPELAPGVPSVLPPLPSQLGATPAAPAPAPAAPAPLPVRDVDLSPDVAPVPAARPSLLPELKQHLSLAEQAARGRSGVDHTIQAKPGDLGELEKGFVGSLVGENPSMAGGALEAVGAIVGSKGLQDTGAQVRQWGDKQLKGYAPRVGSLAQIRTDDLGNFLSDVGAYSGQAIGQAAGSSAPSIISGLAIQAALPELPGVFIVGAAMPSYVQNLGDTYNSLRDELKEPLAKGTLTQRQVASASALAAIPMAALDALPLDRLVGEASAPLRKAVRERVTKAIVLQLAKNAGTQAIFEGVTEGLQQAIQEAVGAYLGGNKSVAQRIMDVLDNAVAGAIGGGAMGGAAGVHQAIHEARAPNEPAGAGAPPPPPFTPQPGEPTAMHDVLDFGAVPGGSGTVPRGRQLLPGADADHLGRREPNLGNLATSGGGGGGGGSPPPDQGISVSFAPPGQPPGTPTAAPGQSNEQRIAELRKELEAATAAADKPAGEPPAAAAPTQGPEPTPAAQPPDSATLASQAGLPTIGSQITARFPDGEVLHGTLADTFQIPAEEEGGQPMTGVRLVDSSGTAHEFFRDEAAIEPFAEPNGAAGTRGAPVNVGTQQDVAAAASQAAGSPRGATPEPTPAQAKAGNYQKGHVVVQGLPITIENDAGSVRRGVGPDGKPWEVEMPAPYGYVKRTGGADGDQVDVYLGPNPDAPDVYIVDQKDPATRQFDEHKAFIGFPDPGAALQTYFRAFSDGSGKARAGALSRMSMADFKTWLRTGDTTKPLQPSKFPTPPRFAGKPASPPPAPSRPMLAPAQERVARGLERLITDGRARIEELRRSVTERNKLLVTQMILQLGRQVAAREEQLRRLTGAAAGQPRPAAKPPALPSPTPKPTAAAPPPQPAEQLPAERPQQPEPLDGEVLGPERRQKLTRDEFRSELDYEDEAWHDGVHYELVESDDGSHWWGVQETHPGEDPNMLDLASSSRDRAIDLAVDAVFGDRADEPETDAKPAAPQPKPSTEPVKIAEAEPFPGQKIPAPSGEDARTKGTIALAHHLRRLIGGDEALTAREIIGLAEKAFGGTLAEGKFDRKDMYDALELGINLWVQHDPGGIDPHASLNEAQEVARGLRQILERLPTQTVRSEEQVTHQQFSTPPDYAYAAAWTANLRRDDVVLEPSAGTGNIAVMAMNAAPKAVVVNEISPRRSALLAELKPDRQFHENADHLNSILPPDVKPTVVVMNPPFSQTAGRMGDKKVLTVGATHIEQALKRLQPGGRLVAIVGRGMEINAPTWRDWWRRIRQEYALRANIGVDGKIYAKNGTTFDTRLLVIDKVAPDEAARPPVIVTMVPDVPALMEALKDVRETRPQPTAAGSAGQSLAGQPSGAAAAPGGQGTGRPGSTVPAAAAPVGAGTGSPSPVNGGAVSGEPASGSRPAAGGKLRPEGGAGESGPLAAEQPGGRKPSGASPVPAGAAAGGGAEPGVPTVGGVPVRPTGGGDASLPVGGGRGVEGVAGEQSPAIAVDEAAADPETGGELTESVYEPYKPQRVQVAGAKPHPGPLVQSAAMATVAPPKPTYQPHLPKELIEAGGVSLAQLEAIIYAGQAHSQMLAAAEGEKPKRRGFFIGDGTGVGKGREVAGIILDNWRQGRKKAVWLSEKRRLIKDAQRDWAGLGQNPNAIINFGKFKPDQKIDATQGVVFLTYDTLKGGLKDQQAAATGILPKGTKVQYDDLSAPGGKSTGVITGKRNKDGTYPLKDDRTGDRMVRSHWSLTPIGEVKGPRTRIDQLVEWLGDDFDGVIAFDESHNMGNAVAMKGSRGVSEPSAKALAGVELQRRLPNARVVYVSATGATEVSNLSYAERLGLWGRGTAFSDRGKFVNDVASGGIAAMELVARDMKALGSYLARNLSYEGVEQDRVLHTLNADQRANYDELARAWQLVLNKINEALVTTGADQNKNARSAAMSAFWSGHQRFFNQIITSMQMPSVVKAVEKDLAEGRVAVLQLVNTNEASQTRALAKIESEEELEDLDLTPRDQLLQLVEKVFPVQQYEEYLDSDGNIRSRPVFDSQGNPVLNPEAVAERDALLDRLGAIRVPDGPLEIILNKFGTDNVAEVTGRSKRVVRKPDPKTGEMRTVVEPRAAESANVAETSAFQSGQKKVLVFSNAGGTGASYHADNTAASKGSRRSHYLVQAGWRADQAIQGFGRTHRTNQASAPIFKLVTTDLKGQKRFISSIARRLSQLGALTKGERKTGDQGMFTARDNLESNEARQALVQFYRDLSGFYGKTIDGISMQQFEAQTGLRLTNLDGTALRDDLPPINQFLNRLLSLEIDVQNLVFDAFEERLQNQIDLAAASGTLDVGLETIRAEGGITKKNEQVVYTDPVSGAETKVVEVTLRHRQHPVDFEGLHKRYGTPKKFVRSARGAAGDIRAVTDANSRTLDNGKVEDMYRLTSPTGYTMIERWKIDGPRAREFWITIPDADAPRVWAEAVKATPEFRESTMHLVTGAILPIWDRLGGSTRVYRMQTSSGEKLLGRLVEPTLLDQTLEKLGAGKKGAMSAADVVRRVLNGERAILANDWIIRRAIVAGEYRIELTGPGPRDMATIKADGVFSERIGYATRFFIPTGRDAEKVLGKVIAAHPVAKMEAPTTGGGPGGSGGGGSRAQMPRDSQAQAAYRAGAAPGMVDRARGILNTVRRRALLRRLLAEMKRLGVENLAALRVADKLEDGSGEFWGMFERLEERITVALTSPGPLGTLRHEIIHLARAAGLFSEHEWGLLTRAAETLWMDHYNIAQRYPNLTRMAQIEEAIAEAFADHEAARSKLMGGLLRLYTRLVRFLKALAAAIKGVPAPAERAKPQMTPEAAAIFDRVDNEGMLGDRADFGTPVSSDRQFLEEWAAAVQQSLGPDVDARALLGLAERAATATTEAMQEAPRSNFSFQAPSQGAGPAGSVEIVERRENNDQSPIKRFLYTPESAVRRYPGLPELVRFGRGTEISISSTTKRLTAEYEAIVRRMETPERFNAVADLLWLGDAEEQLFDEDHLLDMGVDDPRVRQGYREMRQLVEKIGRLVDQHRRSMLPQYRQRKMALVRQMGRLTNMTDPAFRSAYGRRARLRARLRAGTISPAEAEPQLRAIERELNVSRANMPEYAELQEQVDAIDAILAKTSVRRKVGYIPHKFFGSWGVYERTTEQDPDGNPVTKHKLVAGPDGFFPDRQAAVAAAGSYLEANPNANLVVRPLQFQFPASSATALTDAAYWRFVNRVGEAVQLEGDEIHELIRGVARRAFRRRLVGFAMKRQGIEGYSQDLDRVMRTFIGEAVRYVFLDKLKYRAINDLERMGLSPNRSQNQETAGLQAMMLSWFRDVNGQKRPTETRIDDMLEREAARPLRAALAGAAATALATGGVSWVFGGTSNPVLAAGLALYAGAHLYSVLRSDTSFKFRALTGSGVGRVWGPTKLMSHLKLGLLINVGSAVVNLTQTALNTYPILGARYTMRGMMLLERAVQSYLLAALDRRRGVANPRQPNRYWRLLERADVVSGFRYGDTGKHQFAGEGKIEKVSLFFFNKAEEFNRAVAFLGGYQRAIDRGVTEGESFREASETMVRTQHHYGAASKPEILRMSLSRIPGQFRNFMFQQIAFVAGLKTPTGKAYTGWGNREVGRFLLAMFLVGGALGLPFLGVLDMLLKWLTGWSPVTAIKETAMRMQGEGEIPGTGFQLVARGLPGALLGEDLSARAGMGDKFLPSSWGDIVGPTFGTVESMIKLGQLDGGLADYLSALGGGAGKPLKMVEAMANGLPIESAITHPERFYEALTDGKIDLTSPYLGGALLADERQLTDWDLARMAIGSTPVKISEIRDMQAAIAEDEAKRSAQVQKLQARIISAYRRHEKDPKGLSEEIKAIAKEAADAGVVLSKQAVRGALEKAVVPQMIRSASRAPRANRADYIDTIERAAPGLFAPQAAGGQ
jgi:predicted RNA methylase